MGVFSVRKTQDQFVKEVFNLVGDEYTVIGTYETAHKKVEIRHNSCGNQYEVAAYSFLNNGRRCPKCSRVQAGKKRRNSHEKFVKKVYEVLGDEYTVTGTYVNLRSSIEVRHNKCGNVWSPKADKLAMGRGCPKCNGTFLKTHDEFVREVFELVGDEYTVLGEYKGNKFPVAIKHNICDYEGKMMPNNFLRGARCLRCTGAERKTTEQFKKEIRILFGNEYEVLGEYKTTHTKIEMKHECGHIWGITPRNILTGHGCPKCKVSSKGEISIARWLDEKSIKYKYQDKFDDCRNVHPLPFDFKVLGKGKDLHFLLEYDGKQHFEPSEYFGGQEGFEYRQLCDQIKNEYCVENNIPLLRIKYTAFDMIGEILERIIKDPSSLSKNSLSDYFTNENCNYILLSPPSNQC
ncbi:DUF2726 domain-containing protein [Peribacillus asahii]|uniref:DUF2726 domain-containing protein n=1 Tax=Peribacillus asahii TaxID=228899 RepID=UPI00380A353C